MSGRKLKIGNEEIDIVPGFLNDIPVDGVTNNQKKSRKNEVKLSIGGGMSPNPKKMPLQLADSLVQSDVSGKLYPGRVSFADMRALARYSTVVRAIVIMRSQQIAKLPIRIVPKNSKEPIIQTSILKYTTYDIENVPAFDESDVTFLRDIFDRIDEEGSMFDKRKKFKELKLSGEFTGQELAAIEHLQEKHDMFYKKRAKDIKTIEKILSRPDPWFTETPTWNSLINKILEDVLVLDRGTLVKIRDEDGNIQGLLPVDGSTIKPVVNEFGYLDDEKAYLQLINGTPRRYLSKNDVIILTMNPVSDVRYFGYGISPMETLYTAVLSDLFIDKGNLDYYKKGGSIPEGMIAIEPPANKEGIINQIDQEQLDALQRQLQSILMGDFTQIPIVSGGKISWIDFKGKRRDMQFKELAEYLVRKICAVYQVSPQDVGVLEGMKTSDGQVQADLTKSKGLQTIMTLLSEFITESVIQELRPEEDLKLWFEEPEEKEADKNWGTQAKLQAGVLSVNEVRARDGLPPVAWGNTPLANGNTKNWTAQADGAAGGGMPGAPGAPGMGALPPLPGLPGPPGADPIGGAPDPAGAGAPPPVMKSVFDFAENIQQDHLSGGDLTSLVNMYLKDAKIKDEDEDGLDDILTYSTGDEVRSPLDSYQRLLKSVAPDIDIDIYNTEEELILFSRKDGNSIIVDDKGNDPILKTIAKSIAQHEDEVPALEWALLEKLDTGTASKLRKFYYDNTVSVPASEIRKVRSKYLE